MCEGSDVTHDPNIFEVIRSVSSRVEPYHSAFLAAMLRSSLTSGRPLFDAFWRMATPGWQLPEGEVTIRLEDVVRTGRVGPDAVGGRHPRPRRRGEDPRRTSTTSGQLARYQEGLEGKYTGRDLAIAYLTPFNGQRAGGGASALPSVREFRKFAEMFPRSQHMSWLDLAEVDWDGGELWEQHREYVRSQIASQQQLEKWLVGRSRELSHFFGPVAAEEFDEQLGAAVGDLDGYVLDLDQVQGPAAFASAFRVLIESDAVRSAKGRPNTFDDASRERFLTAGTASVHRAIFALAAEYPNVWIEGRVDYGLRVAHPDHRGGVSLVTSRGVERFEVGRPR